MDDSTCITATVIPAITSPTNAFLMSYFRPQFSIGMIHFGPCNELADDFWDCHCGSPECGYKLDGVVEHTIIILFDFKTILTPRALKAKRWPAC